LLFHSSTPCWPSSTVNISVPLTFVSEPGDPEYRLLGWKSLTSTVPAAVPSLFHRSRELSKDGVPFTFVCETTKYSVSLPLVNAAGPVATGWGLPSLTRVVPAAVPSPFHNSEPVVPSSAVKNSVPFTTVRLLGSEPKVEPPGGGGLMYLMRVVPAAVP